MTENILILAGGDLGNLAWARDAARHYDLAICADGGLRHARRLSLVPFAVVGDLDSMSRRLIWGLMEEGVKILRYPGEKDETDLDLALDYALSRNPRSIDIMGALGKRTDHLLGNLLLMVKYKDSPVPIRALREGEEIFLVRSGAIIKARKDAVMSLIPLGGKVKELTLEGFRYPLRKEDLHLGETRGISNVFQEDSGKVTFKEGLLLAVCRM